MIKVLIIEDEAIAARNLKRMLADLQQNIIVVETIGSKEQAIALIPILDIDVILMDIHLEDGSSFGIFEKINCTQPIIFTSAYDKYILRAFKHLSIDYLLKPIVQNELQNAFDKYEAHFSTNQNGFPINELMGFLGQQKKYKNRFLVQVGNQLKSIEIEEIAYFLSKEKTTYLVNLQGRKFPIEFSLIQLEKKLNPEDFFRINRQLLISRKSILNIHYLFSSKLEVVLTPKLAENSLLTMEKVTAFKQWLQ